MKCLQITDKSYAFHGIFVGAFLLLYSASGCLAMRLQFEKELLQGMMATCFLAAEIMWIHLLATRVWRTIEASKSVDESAFAEGMAINPAAESQLKKLQDRHLSALDTYEERNWQITALHAVGASLLVSLLFENRGGEHFTNAFRFVQTIL